MSLDDKDRQHLIEHRINRAVNTIEDVQFLINNDKLVMAVNRIYYGIFYAMSALALKHQFATSKHQQLIGWFNNNYIKEKKIDIKFGEILRKAFEKRSKGDYDDWVEFEKDEIQTLFDEMKMFIDKIQEIIKS